MSRRVDLGPPKVLESLDEVVMEELRALDQEFIDRIVAAIAASRYDGKTPTKEEIEDWFRFAVKIAIAREKFQEALSDAAWGRV